MASIVSLQLSKDKLITGNGASYSSVESSYYGDATDFCVTAILTDFNSGTVDIDIETSPDGINYFKVKSIPQITGNGIVFVNLNSTNEFLLRYTRAKITSALVVAGSAKLSIGLNYGKR